MNHAFGTPYFNLTADRCRAIGARGGRRRALNLRLRQAGLAPSAPQVDLLPEEMAHEASLFLDQKFPYLSDGGPTRGARGRLCVVARKRQRGDHPRFSASTLFRHQSASSARWPPACGK